jgi:hypothetical protein
MKASQRNRTGDILHDAAYDLDEEWPFHALAFRSMRTALESIVKYSTDAEDRRYARAALKRAVIWAEGGLPKSTQGSLLDRPNSPRYKRAKNKSTKV